MAAAPASSTPAPRLRSIEDFEDRLESAPRDERVALRQLARAWQLPATDDEPCSAASRQDVGCYRSHGSLPLLRQLARPVVLGLRDGHDRPVYAVLAGLGPDTALLAINGLRLDVPLALLTTAWRGDYATFWREPAGYTGAISEGARGPLVDLLAARLAQQQGASAPAPSQPFDSTLKARVYTFQLAQGLAPDGVVGPTTLMQLNRASGVDEPWLITGTAAPIAQGK
jgi:general secretion pathway protein A